VKITVFGLTISSSWGNGHATPTRAIFRALHRLGHEMHFFERDVPYYRLRRDFESCDYCALTLYPDWDAVRQFALKVARESDVVIATSYLPQGLRVCNEILQLAEPLRVFYDLDTPITLENLKNGGVEYLEPSQIPAFDLVLSFTGGDSLHILETKYGARLVRPLHGCVDPDVYGRVKPSADFACEMSYMGTFACDRQPKLESLFVEPARKNRARRFLLAGSLYPQHWVWPQNICKVEHVAPQDHPRFYSSSRLTLNITRREMARNGWCPSGRFFEAAACGTPLITDWWEGLDSFFDPEHDLRVVTTTRDVEEALGLADAELRMLARNARRRTLEEHTGEARAAQLLLYLEEARSSPALKMSTGGPAS
jgi:spore maturation protein CgeB